MDGTIDGGARAREKEGECLRKSRILTVSSGTAEKKAKKIEIEMETTAQRERAVSNGSPRMTRLRQPSDN